MSTEVRVDWLGVATFRVTVGDLVVFLDAYMDRPAAASQLDLRPEQVESADFVLVGHSHGDHLWGAERIARNTGAIVIGSHETVRILADEEEIPEGQLMVVGGGERIRLNDDVSVRAFPSLHSCAWATENRPDPEAQCVGDLGLFQHEREANMRAYREGQASAPDPDGLRAMAREVRARSRQRPRTDGGAWSYLLETPAGSVYWSDTMGYWTGVIRDLRPDVAILAAVGRGNADGEPIQGTVPRFIAQQVELMRPSKVILGHHDDYAPPETRPASLAEDAVREELARLWPPVELLTPGYLEDVRIL